MAPANALHTSWRLNRCIPQHTRPRMPRTALTSGTATAVCQHVQWHRAISIGTRQNRVNSTASTRACDDTENIFRYHKNHPTNQPDASITDPKKNIRPGLLRGFFGSPRTPAFVPASTRNKQGRLPHDRATPLAPPHESTPMAVSRERVWVSHDHKPPPRARYGHVQTAPVPEEAHPAAVIGTHSRQDDHLRIAPVGQGGFGDWGRSLKACCQLC